MKRVKYYSNGLPENINHEDGDSEYQIGTCLPVEAHTLILAFVDDMAPIWSISCPDARHDDERKMNIGGCVKIPKKNRDEATDYNQDNGMCWLMQDIEKMGWELIGGSDLMIGFQIVEGFSKHGAPRVIPIRVDVAVLANN